MEIEKPQRDISRWGDGSEHAEIVNPIELPAKDYAIALVVLVILAAAEQGGLRFGVARGKGDGGAGRDGGGLDEVAQVAAEGGGDAL